jgi:hypothetical protein
MYGMIKFNKVLLKDKYSVNLKTYFRHLLDYVTYFNSFTLLTNDSFSLGVRRENRNAYRYSYLNPNVIEVNYASEYSANN